MMPKESMREPMPDGKDASAEEGEGQGYSVVINCKRDGTHDVFAKPMEPATEEQYPDGLFGLDSLEDALKGVIAIKKQGPDYASAEDEGMMQGYGGGSADDEEMGG